MKLKHYYPENALTMSTREFLDFTQGAWVAAALDSIAEWYNSRLSLRALLAEYGVEVDPSAKEAQINCTFHEHGSTDSHKSARYYSYDRNENTQEERVYCFKCEKVVGAFWYAFKQKKDYEGKKLKDVFLWIEQRFGIPFPKHILLEFDMEAHFQFGQTTKNKTVSLFAHARSLRAYRNPQGWNVFIPEWKGVYKQRAA